MLTSALTVKERVTGVGEQTPWGSGGRGKSQSASVGGGCPRENDHWRLEIKRERGTCVAQWVN